MKNSVNKILGCISIATAIFLIADIVVCCKNYYAFVGTGDIAFSAIALSVGATIMTVIGIRLFKSEESNPYLRILIMVVLVAAAIYGMGCVNSMLAYVAHPYLHY